MDILKLINPEGVSDAEAATYKLREASRAVVFDAEGKVALLYVSKQRYHKLPGGGIEEGESKEEALRRECREEIGCEIDIGDYLGETVEYRKQFSVNQHCFGWIAKVRGEKGQPHFEKNEIDNDFRIEWQSLDDAIKLVQNGSKTDYEAPFIIERELLFLKEAKRFKILI